MDEVKCLKAFKSCSIFLREPFKKKKEEKPFSQWDTFISCFEFLVLSKSFNFLSLGLFPCRRFKYVYTLKYCKGILSVCSNVSVTLSF